GKPQTTIAVGTAVTRCPPHRPVLAALPHTVLTSGMPPEGGWRRIARLDNREPRGARVAIDRRVSPAFPGGPPLAALSQRMKPVAGDLLPESFQHRQISRDCMVLVITVKHTLQPSADLRHRFVHLPAEFLPDRLRFLPPSVAVGNAPD